MSNLQYNTQLATTKITYTLNQFPTNLQITVGGRGAGSVKVTYRPYLPGKETVELSDFDIPANNVIHFDVQAGVLDRTFTLQDIRLSHITIDDTGGSGNFWVQIVQF